VARQGGETTARPARPPVQPGTTPTPTTAELPPTAATAPLQTIDEVLASDLNDTQKAQQLLALFPKMKAEDQEEAIQHISNLTTDEAYAPLAKIFTNPAQPESVLDALMSDVLNRGDELKLPLLLEVARKPNHAMASDARDVLEIYLEHDYGTDWAAWDNAVKQWLKENGE
jgi:hypothetical protein